MQWCWVTWSDLWIWPWLVKEQITLSPVICSLNKHGLICDCISQICCSYIIICHVHSCQKSCQQLTSCNLTLNWDLWLPWNIVRTQKQTTVKRLLSGIWCTDVHAGTSTYVDNFSSPLLYKWMLFVLSGSFSHFRILSLLSELFISSIRVQCNKKSYYECHINIIYEMWGEAQALTWLLGLWVNKVNSSNLLDLRALISWIYFNSSLFWMLFN